MAAIGAFRFQPNKAAVTTRSKRKVLLILIRIISVSNCSEEKEKQTEVQWSAPTKWLQLEYAEYVRVVIWGKRQKSGKEQTEESELEKKQEESEEKTSPGSTQG